MALLHISYDCADDEEIQGASSNDGSLIETGNRKIFDLQPELENVANDVVMF